jgi:hypothetical protein
MRHVRRLLIALMIAASAMAGSALRDETLALEAAWRPDATPSAGGSQLRVPFILNDGQVDRRVKFYAKTAHGTTYVTARGEIVYDLPKAKRDTGITGWSVKEELAGATIRSIVGAERATTSVSYFVGKDPSRWKSDIPTYTVVSLPEVYRGIDVNLKASGAAVEKVFTVKPGANPRHIRVRVAGALSLHTTNDGDLQIETGVGAVVLTRPRAHQTRGGVTTEIDVAYLADHAGYSFRVGAYDRTIPLIIDPILQATYLGGNDTDSAQAIVTSGTDAVYIAGSTSSTDFPGTTEGAHDTKAGLSDAFVALLSADLKTIVQATYFGGSDSDDGNAVAVSGSDVYVAGRTLSTDLPATSGAARPANAGVADAFVARFSSDLKSLVRASYFGGVDEDSASSIALMGTGAYGVFISGLTASGDLVGILNSAQPLKGDPNRFPVGQNLLDGFIAAFSSDLTQLTQATYLGGRESDQILAISGTPGFIYATGRTFSSDFPKTAGGFQAIRNPVNLSTNSDAFVALLTSDLTTLVQATYLGGEGQDIANAIAVSGSGVYITGETGSAGFPGTLGGAYPTKVVTASDGFAALLNTGLNSLTQATFLGGTFLRRGLGLGVGSSFSGSVVYIVGENLTPTGIDAFVTALSGNLTILLSDGVFGGAGPDSARAIAIPPTLSGFHVYAAGSTDSTNFPNTAGGAQAAKSTGFDGFVGKLALVPDYSFSPIPEITLTPDSSGSTTVTVNSLNGFTNESVKLGIFAAPTGGPLPIGISAPNFAQDIGPTPPNGSLQFELTIEVSAAVTPSTYTLWLLGFPSSSVTHAAPVVVNVVATFMGVQNLLSTIDAAGCIDRGLTRAFSSTLNAAQSDASAGRAQDAVGTLNALIYQIRSQRGKRLATTCTIDTVIVDPAAVLTANVQGLITTIAP